MPSPRPTPFQRLRAWISRYSMTLVVLAILPFTFSIVSAADSGSSNSDSNALAAIGTVAGFIISTIINNRQNIKTSKAVEKVSKRLGNTNPANEGDEAGHPVNLVKYFEEKIATLQSTVDELTASLKSTTTNLETTIRERDAARDQVSRRTSEAEEATRKNAAQITALKSELTDSHDTIASQGRQIEAYEIQFRELRGDIILLKASQQTNAQTGQLTEIMLGLKAVVNDLSLRLAAGQPSVPLTTEASPS